MKYREKFKYFARHFVLPIRAGPLAGKKWIVASGLRFLRGNYEEANIEAFSANIGSGDVVYDIGGHVGYFSVLASELVGSTGRVFTFEPRPLNVAYIRKHIKANRIENIEVVEAAVSRFSGQARFNSELGTGRGRLSRSGNISVPAAAIDELVNGGHLPPPDFIKMDIEGAETDALEGMTETVEKFHPRMLISTHGKRKLEEVSSFLRRNGYELSVPNGQETGRGADILACPG